MEKLPSREELQKAWEELKELHKRYLKERGVKIPKDEKFDSTNKSIQLAVLHFNKGKKVHKGYISKVVRKYKPNASGDQQVRHLKRDGWDIGKVPGIHKLNPHWPSAEFIRSSARKNSKLKAETFDDIKYAFGYKCATCGADEGRPNPRYGDTPVQLQQGHQDPLEPGDEPKNIIPQCQFCNRTYKDFFVFDDKGRVKTIASVEPVKKARESVKKEVLDYLRSEEEENTKSKKLKILG